LVASVEGRDDGKKVGAVVRSGDGISLITITGKFTKKKLASLLGIAPTTPLREIKDPGLTEELYHMEVKDLLVRKQYKFGVLYSSPTDVTENQMFSNRKFPASWKLWIILLLITNYYLNHFSFSGG
jgi:hypothetical protein